MRLDQEGAQTLILPNNPNEVHMTKQEDLKPCPNPWCDKSKKPVLAWALGPGAPITQDIAARNRHSRRVFCGDIHCRLRGPTFVCAEDGTTADADREAVKAWNTRQARQQSDALLAEARAVFAGLEEGDYEFLQKYLWVYREFGNEISKARVDRILSALHTHNRDSVIEDLERVTDHLETWAGYHPEDRTSDIEAAIYCARQHISNHRALTGEKSV